MRVGLVTVWCNRGQGVVMRQIRSVLDEAGHDTFVLARPTSSAFPVPRFVDTTGPWNQPGITVGSSYKTAPAEYVAWAYRHRLDAVFCFTNRQWQAVRMLRERGIRTIGTFMWETFPASSVAPAADAYDVLFSLTDSGLRHFEALGLEAHRVRWGVHPELERAPGPERRGPVRLLFHGGVHESREFAPGVAIERKPLDVTLEAFARIRSPDVRLVVKTQTDGDEVRHLAAHDGRISVVGGDLDQDSYEDLVEGCDVLLAPSRWEGLGVHLYEALASSTPVVGCDFPPVNEVVVDGTSGRLCGVTERWSGDGEFAVWEPDPDDLERCIREVVDRRRVAELSAGARDLRSRFDWKMTRDDLLALLE